MIETKTTPETTSYHMTENEKINPESTSYHMTEKKKEIQNQGVFRCLKIKADPE